MGSIRNEIITVATPAEVWDAIRDIGALHTRLVPGFVTDTKLEPGARIVTFGNGAVIREPIVSLDDAAMRLVWTTADSKFTTHYNGSVQVSPGPDGGARVVWIADFLPDEAGGIIEGFLKSGMEVMKATLDGNSARRRRLS